VVIGIDALPRRAGPRDDRPTGGGEVADRRPTHGRVGEHERRHGLVAGGDHDPIRLAANREVGCASRDGGAHTASSSYN
jgi:hypothetical protein